MDVTDTTTTETTTEQTADAAEATAVNAADAGTTDAAAENADDSTILGGDAKDEGGEHADAQTAQAPEKYELTASEGFTLDADTLAEADPVFRQLNLTNEQAQTLVPVAEKFAERIATQARDAANQSVMGEVLAQRKAWAEEARTDAEIGGARWEETQELSAKALDALGYPKGSSFRSFLTDTGLGNHPEMIRAMRRVGELVGEDGDFVRGDPAHKQTDDRLSVLYPNDVPNNQGAG